MSISDTRDLCDFVSTYAAEFNHVNVATAFNSALIKNFFFGKKKKKNPLAP
jgi:hypothetical protein